MTKFGMWQGDRGKAPANSQQVKQWFSYELLLANIQLTCLFVDPDEHVRA
jgi:hypothetical protein